MAATSTPGPCGEDGPQRIGNLFEKTRLCRFFSRGRCERGSTCKFAHGKRELHAQPDFFRTKLCADFLQSGTCQAIGECKFAHSPEELRTRCVTGRQNSEEQVLSIQEGNVGPDVEAVCNYMKQMRDLAMSVRLQLMRVQAQVAMEGVSPSVEQAAAMTRQGAGENTSKGHCSPSSCKSMDSLDDLGKSAFCRQSTEEGVESVLSFGGSQPSCADWDTANMSFGRQMSSPVRVLKVVPMKYSVQEGVYPRIAESNRKLLEHKTLTTSQAEVPLQSEEPDDFIVTTKNTFIHIEVDTKVPGKARRARSAPACARS